MKKFIALVCIVTVVKAGVLTEDILEILGEQVDFCATEVDASADDAAIVKNYEVPPTHEGKCILFCMHKMYNMQNEAGDLSLEGVLSTLVILEDDMEIHDKMEKVFRTCVAKVVPDSDPCITAGYWQTCRIEEGEALGMPSSTFTK